VRKEIGTLWNENVKSYFTKRKSSQIIVYGVRHRDRSNHVTFTCRNDDFKSTAIDSEVCASFTTDTHNRNDRGRAAKTGDGPGGWKSYKKCTNGGRLRVLVGDRNANLYGKVERSWRVDNIVRYPRKTIRTRWEPRDAPAKPIIIIVIITPARDALSIARPRYVSNYY